jgi:microcystin-dependent protein
MEEYKKIILRQGIESDRKNVIYSLGEPVYVTDYQRLFVGDGATFGGMLACNKFLGFANFDFTTNSSGVVSAYQGDILFDLTSNNLLVLTGTNTSNVQSYSRLTRNFTADNITTVLNQTSAISVKTYSLNATYLSDSSVGRGLEKDPSDNSKIRLSDTSLNGGLDFDINGKLKVATFSIGNSALSLMRGNSVKGNLGTYGQVEDIPLQDLAAALAPLLVGTSQILGVPVGSIIDFAGTTPPNGYLLCNGANYAASLYPELFNTIGTTWGGNVSSFNVPDLRRKTTIGSGGISTSTINNNVGSIGGTESVILQKQNIPSHTHGINSVVGGGTLSLSTSAGNLKIDDSRTGNGIDDGLTSDLGDPFSIIQPSAVVTKCIRAF